MNNEVSFACLKPHERDFFVSRICCGYCFISINNVRYKYIHPNKDIMLEANEVYSKTYNECVNQTITNEEILNLLIQEYGWNYDNEKFLSDFHDTSRQLKIDLFKSMYNQLRKENIRKQLRDLEKESNRLFGIKNSFNHMTAEGIAEADKWSFIANKCIFSVQNRSRQTFNMQKTKSVINVIWENYLTDKILREISKNEPWSSMWYASQGRNIFNGKYSDYNNEQIRLISWSRMYDNIRKSHKPPSEDVIEDDDALDGWMSNNSIEREKERNLENAESKLTNKKIRGSQEVFVPVSSHEEFKKIEDLNSNENKSKKKDMLTKLKGS